MNIKKVLIAVPATSSTFWLNYYLRLAKDLENAGTHILGVKDMSKKLV